MNVRSIAFVTTGDIKDIATAKRALGMANPLFELGWEVHIVIKDTVENKNRITLECNSKINVHYYTGNSFLAELKEKNDILNSIECKFIYLCGFVLRNIVRKKTGRIFLSEHSELLSEIPNIPYYKRKLYGYLEKYSVKYSDGLLNASNYLETYFKSYKPKKSLYFPYAFSTENLFKKSLKQIKPSIQVLSDKKNLVYLGTVRRNYGIFTMLEAFKYLNKNNLRLIILGAGKHFEEAVDYVEANGLKESVSLMGFIDEEDISDYFSIADGFLSPMNDTVQDKARCPSKLYMYLPYCKPVITCKLGEPYEVLDNDGFYYKPNNSKNLSTTILKALQTKEIPEIWKEHTWSYRSNQFDQWISHNFNR